MIGMAALVLVGAHLGTLHSEPGFEGVNPGAYVRTAGGWSGGIYRNSERGVSLWGGRTWETSRAAFGPVNVRAAATLGAVTGYRRADVLPLVNGSLAFDLGGPQAVRLTLIPLPKSEGAVHLSFEVEL